LLQHSSQDNQPKFDMVESSGIGYHYLYHERQYLLRLVALPFLVKFLTTIILSLFGENISYFSASIVIIPSLFAEGWLLAQVIRSFAFNERWPIMLSGEKDIDKGKLLNRQTCLIAAIVTYVVIHMAFYAVQSTLMITTEEFEMLTKISAGETLADGADISYTPILAALGLLFTLIFWFPLIWLYIPAAANIYFKDFYLTVLRQRMALRIIGCYMICLIPFIAGLTLFNNFIGTAFSIDMFKQSTAESIFFDGVSQFVSLLVGIVSTVAITHGISQFFGAKK
jgi:hypothetical protein